MDKVVLKTNQTTKDYWFVWSDDYEPIRISYENGVITSVLHRFHWQHNVISNPYTNTRNRIEAFFIPLCHTPFIRRQQLDFYFYVLVKGFEAQRVENYSATDEEIPDYFTSAGKKDKHSPPVEYKGWPGLV